jgi:ABC-2 type transport system permease protein
MSRVLALMVAQWRTLVSYRLQTVFSLGGLVFTVVPLFFIAKAVEPVMAKSIESEGGHAFGFLLIGTVALLLVSAALTILPTAITSGIGSGTLEALLATPTPTPVLVVGLSAFGVLDASVRAAVLLAAGWALGANLAPGQLPAGLLILAIIVLAHFSIGLLSAAMILAFRTAGPLPKLVILSSSLLGGVYYPTHVIPSWLQYVSALLPLSYGLRPLRRVLLQDASLAAVAPELLTLVGITVLLFSVGAGAFWMALRYARHQGTLTQY